MYNLEKKFKAPGLKLTPETHLLDINPFDKNFVEIFVFVLMFFLFN